MPYKIIIDAGHGGFDNGASYGDRLEKNDTLELALAVGQILSDNGLEVEFTRTTDVYQRPQEKATFANERNADLFLSLHRNSSVEPNLYSGIQTLIYNTGDIKETFADNINSELEQLGFTNLGKSVRTDLVVLNQTKMPALLVEAGFINNDYDNAVFDEQIYAVAEAIATGVLNTIADEN